MIYDLAVGGTVRYEDGGPVTRMRCEAGTRERHPSDRQPLGKERTQHRVRAMIRQAAHKVEARVRARQNKT
ncbi:hypothetical protein GCM10007886_03020 [Methylobacterium gregans]|nr:hypothetical protein GCM10007886_03020 [Methylobacterium gregans]